METTKAESRYIEMVTVFVFVSASMAMTVYNCAREHCECFDCQNGNMSQAYWASNTNTAIMCLLNFNFIPNGKFRPKSNKHHGWLAGKNSSKNQTKTKTIRLFGVIRFVLYCVVDYKQQRIIQMIQNDTLHFAATTLFHFLFFFCSFFLPVRFVHNAWRPCSLQQSDLIANKRGECRRGNRISVEYAKEFHFGLSFVFTFFHYVDCYETPCTKIANTWWEWEKSSAPQAIVESSKL